MFSFAFSRCESIFAQTFLFYLKMKEMTPVYADTETVFWKY